MPKRGRERRMVLGTGVTVAAQRAGMQDTRFAQAARDPARPQATATTAGPQEPMCFISPTSGVEPVSQPFASS